MTKLVHQKVMKTTMVEMGATCYVAFSCDEVFTMNNKSWLNFIKLESSCAQRETRFFKM